MQVCCFNFIVRTMPHTTTKCRPGICSIAHDNSPVSTASFCMSTVSDVRKSFLCFLIFIDFLKIHSTSDIYTKLWQKQNMRIVESVWQGKQIVAAARNRTLGHSHEQSFVRAVTVLTSGENNFVNLCLVCLSLGAVILSQFRLGPVFKCLDIMSLIFSEIHTVIILSFSRNAILLLNVVKKICDTLYSLGGARSGPPNLLIHVFQICFCSRYFPLERLRLEKLSCRRQSHG